MFEKHRKGSQSIKNKLLWSERVAERSEVVTVLPHSLQVLHSRYFWWKCLFAFRSAVVAMVPIATLQVITSTKPAFASPYLSITLAMMSTRPTVGGTMLMLLELVRSCSVTIPLMTLYSGVHLYSNGYAWSVFYMVTLIVLGYLFEGFTKKFMLVLTHAILLAMMRSHWDHLGNATRLSFPVHMMGDFAIGSAFGLLACFIPFPKFAFRRADQKIDQAAEFLSLCFHGFCDSFWATSNLQRRLKLSHIKQAQKYAVADLADAKEVLGECRLEPQSTDRYYLRLAKFQLLSSLVPLVDSTIRVLETVSENPALVHGSEKAIAFGTSLAPSLRELAAAFEDSLALISKATSHEELHYHHHRRSNSASGGRDDDDHHDHPLHRVKLALHNLERSFALARRDIFHTVPHQLTGSSHHLFSPPDELENNQQISHTNKDIQQSVFLPPSSAPADGAAHRLQSGGNNYTAPSAHLHVGSLDNPVTVATVALSGYASPAEQEFTALMCFYVFSLSQYGQKVLKFPQFADGARKGRSFLRGCVEEVVEHFMVPFMNLKALVAFCSPRSWLTSISPDVRVMAAVKFKESVKFALAMGAANLFNYYTDRSHAFVYGPMSLCFISSLTSSEALFGSVGRLFGTLFGGIIGLFFSHYIHNEVQQVAVLSAVCCFFGFFRTGIQHGGAATYASVQFIPMVAVPTTNDAMLSRVTQIIFAILMYTFISIVIFPTKPMDELANARVVGVVRMGKALRSLAVAFRAPMPNSNGGGAADPHGASISISNEPFAAHDEDQLTCTKTKPPRGAGDPQDEELAAVDGGDSEMSPESSIDSNDPENEELEEIIRVISENPIGAEKEKEAGDAVMIGSTEADFPRGIGSSAENTLVMGRAVSSQPQRSAVGDKDSGMFDYRDGGVSNRSIIVADNGEELYFPSLQPHEGGDLLGENEKDRLARRNISTHPFAIAPVDYKTETNSSIVAGHLDRSPAAPTATAVNPYRGKRKPSVLDRIFRRRERAEESGQPQTVAARLPNDPERQASDGDKGVAEPPPMNPLGGKLRSLRSSIGDSKNSPLDPLAADSFVTNAAQAVRELSGAVAKATAWMPLAEMEPVVTRLTFPSGANRDYHNSVVAIQSLLELMCEALRTLRMNRDTPSPYLVALVDDLSPFVTDCSNKFESVVQMIAGMIDDSGKGGAPTEHDPEAEAVLLDSTSGRQTERRLSPSLSVTVSQSPQELGGEGCDDSELTSRQRKARESIRRARRVISAVLRFEEACLALHFHKTLGLQRLLALSRIVYHKRVHQQRKCKERRAAANGLALAGEASQADAAGLPTKSGTLYAELEAGQGRFKKPLQDWSDEELCAAADYVIAKCDAGAFNGTTTSGNADSAADESSRKLKMLISNADSEGLHTFTFCLIIFSKELKKMLVSADVLRHHGKMVYA